MESKLIELVRTYPLLYDSNNKEYKNQELRRNAWVEIGELIGVSGNTCKNRWTKLRNCYTNALQRRKNRESLNNTLKWKLEDQMSFLGLVSEQQSICSADSDTETYKIEESSILDPSVDLTNALHCSDFSLPAPSEESFPKTVHKNLQNNVRKPKKRRLVKSTISEMVEIMKESNQEQSRCASVPHECAQQIYANDETEMLFLSLARTVKQLSPQEQARTKMDVSNIVFQAEFRHAQCTEPEPYDYQPQSPYSDLEGSSDYKPRLG